MMVVSGFSRFSIALLSMLAVSLMKQLSVFLLMVTIHFTFVILLNKD